LIYYNECFDMLHLIDNDDKFFYYLLSRILKIKTVQNIHKIFLDYHKNFLNITPIENIIDFLLIRLA
jgi:hypothetical protein